MKMDNKSYYICDINLSKNRDIERVICFHSENGKVNIISFVGDCQGNCNDFYYFKALKKIDLDF